MDIKVCVSYDQYWGLIYRGNEFEETFLKLMRQRGVIDENKEMDLSIMNFDKGREDTALDLTLVEKIDKLVKEFSKVVKKKIDKKRLVLLSPSVLVYEFVTGEKLCFVIASKVEDDTLEDAELMGVIKNRIKND